MEFSNYFFSQNPQVSKTSKQTAEKEQMAERVMRVHCAPAELKRNPGCPASDLPRLPGPGHRTPSLERNTSGAESATSSAKPPALPPAPRSFTPRPVASFLAKLPLWSLVPPEASVSSAHLQKFQAGLAPRLASAKTIYPGWRLWALAE